MTVSVYGCVCLWLCLFVVVSVCGWNVCGYVCLWLCLFVVESVCGWICLCLVSVLGWLVFFVAGFVWTLIYGSHDSAVLVPFAIIDYTGRLCGR